MMHPPLLERPTVIPDSSRSPGTSQYAGGTSQPTSTSEYVYLLLS